MFRTTAFAGGFLLVVAGAAHAQTGAEVAARLTPALHSCERASGNAGTYPQALCYRDEQDRQDHRLDQAWSNASKRLPSARRGVFGRDEDAWIKSRDVKCQEGADDLRGATAAFVFNRCMVLEAIRRTLWLEKQR
jgi:uncharacterized protein YecT (DUF1311 family)